MLFMGIDVGTQGVRAIVSDPCGRIVASHSEAFDRLNIATVPGHSEQDPHMWWEKLCIVVPACVKQLQSAGISADRIQTVAVDGTSGTVLPVDENGKPLSPAIMYNDMRAVDETARIREAAGVHEQKMGLRFNPSFSLPRLLWMKNHGLWDKAHMVIHQTDYIVGRLCGEFGVSDYSNSLKTGYDLIDETWPDFFSKLDLDTEKLPHILPPGEPVGTITNEASRLLGLSTGTRVVTGVTDGYASALAAGVAGINDWASIIGTTLVLKGVSSRIILDPTGSSYCHKLPSGSWMVGGASNVGGRCLNQHFDPKEFLLLDQEAGKLSPTGVLIYPLTGTGERYPFVNTYAEAFTIGDISDCNVHYTALMEGVGYTERLCFEHNLDMGCDIGKSIFTSGGACKSDVWLRIRANILKRQLRVPAVVEAAMGTALVAASRTYFSGLEEAAAHMITFAKTVDPDLALAERYDELYNAFHQEVTNRYIKVE